MSGSSGSERLELSGGLRVAVWDVPGPPSACPGGEGVRAHPLLLLHGLPLASRIWRGVIPLLAARGHRTVAVDLVGLGESDKPLTFPYTLSGLTDLASDLLGSLAKETQPWVVAGHDLGGLLALVLAARRPELVAAAVALDATASPSHPFPWMTLFAARPSSLAGVFRLGQPGGLRGILRSLWRPGDTPPEGLVDDGAKAFARPDAVWALAKVVDGVGTTPEEELAALREELRGIPRPVLVVRGEADAALPPDAARDLAGLIPGARLKTIPEAGHLTPLEQPERVADLIACFADEVNGDGAR